MKIELELLTKNGDGGDSCNRTCAAALAHIYEDEQVGLKFLDELNNPKRPWLWRRSSLVGLWVSFWDRMSRDQTIPMLILLGEARAYKKLAWYIFGHAMRLMLFTHNTRRNFVYPMLGEHLAKSTPDVPWRPGWKLPDVTGPEVWALLIRAMPKPLRCMAWPLLLVFDLETLGGSITRRYFRPKNNDVINHTLVLINGKRRAPTPVIWLAAKITPRHFLQSRLDAFFSDAGEPPLHDLLWFPVRRYL